jgi:hypothetical protein
MNGPPLSPSEIRQVLGRAVDQYVAIGLDRSTPIAATARDFATTESKVAALVEAEQCPTGLLLTAESLV